MRADFIATQITLISLNAGIEAVRADEG